MVGLVIVGWFLIGCVVVFAAYRWRSEMRQMADDGAMAVGLFGFWKWLVHGLLALLWPVILYAAIRRQVKYGAEEGPTE